jgi:hypothetical protein
MRGQADAFSQLGNFTTGQLAHLADGQGFDAQAGVLHPLELEQRAADRLGHAMYLAVLAFV